MVLSSFRHLGAHLREIFADLDQRERILTATVGLLEKRKKICKKPSVLG
jgi:hypothetical protein